MLSPDQIRELVDDVKGVFSDWTDRDVGLNASDILATFAALTHAYAPLVGEPASAIFKNNLETALELEDMEEVLAH